MLSFLAIPSSFYKAYIFLVYILNARKATIPCSKTILTIFNIV